MESEFAFDILPCTSLILYYQNWFLIFLLFMHFNKIPFIILTQKLVQIRQSTIQFHVFVNKITY